MEIAPVVRAAASGSASVAVAASSGSEVTSEVTHGSNMIDVDGSGTNPGAFVSLATEDVIEVGEELSRRHTLAGFIGELERNGARVDMEELERHVVKIEAFLCGRLQTI